MRFSWPVDTVFTQRILTVEPRTCAHCARPLRVCDHRFHRLFTLAGPVALLCQVARFPRPTRPPPTHTPRRYQTMVAARHQDAAQLAAAYEQVEALVLTIDGLQPEKGHETLYVVRELQAKRVWFAEPLLSSTPAEIQRLIAKAKQWAEQLAKPVQLWMSDKQEAFLQAIAVEFPDVPHRYCQNHFVRDVAKPVL